MTPDRRPGPAFGSDIRAAKLMDVPRGGASGDCNMIKRLRLGGYLDSPSVPEEVKVEIRRILRDNKVILPGWTPSFLRSLGNVRTVIDVGVLNGTPALYQAFPDARLILVEALPMYEETCRQLLADRREGELHMCAVGAVDGLTRIRYYPDRPATSSLLETDKEKDLALVEIDVPLRRLDGLLADRPLAGDVLLKIDVEGMELEVLKGSVGLLPQVKYIIAETSVRRRHKNSYRFADLVGFLATQGFDLYDALRLTRSKAMQPGASIMDAIFVNGALE